MFMRAPEAGIRWMDTPGVRQLLEGDNGRPDGRSQGSKDRPSSRLGARLPGFASTATIGRLPRPTKSTIEWLCPPRRFLVARDRVPATPRLAIDSRAARPEIPPTRRYGRGPVVDSGAKEPGLSQRSRRGPRADRGARERNALGGDSRGIGNKMRAARAVRVSSAGNRLVRRAGSAQVSIGDRVHAEADSLSFAERWTHALPPGLDALRTRRRGFLVSTAEPRGPDDELTLLLEKSRDAILRRLRQPGVARDPGAQGVRDPRGARFARPNRDPEGKRSSGKRSQAPSWKPETLHRAAQRSLREFCELRGLPKRGALPQKERPAPSAGGSGDAARREDAGEPFAREGKERVARGGSFVVSLAERRLRSNAPGAPRDRGHVFFEPAQRGLEGPRRWTKTENSSDITNLTDSASGVPRLHRGWHSVRIETRGLCTARRTPRATGFSTRFGRHRCPRDCRLTPTRPARDRAGGARGREEMLKRARELCRTALADLTGGRRRAPPTRRGVARAL
ncbi:hypothetical protein Q5P01_000520 [Channa striata]|uniref:Uncharacterized protein n=1 Tax=Channa striata TaxID=64152 RepID=A0AA88IRX3_CHASR|nr:hypothetical protein Q5P01_000520 [Channa striata]